MRMASPIEGVGMRKTIEFRVAGCSWSDDGFSPYIHLADPEEDLQNLEHHDEVVIEAQAALLEVDYPLSRPARFILEADTADGFTRGGLARKISEAYRNVYAAEDAACGPTGNIPGMLNRTQSGGPYGIWGHHLGDLDLSEVHVELRHEGLLLTLGVDS